MEKRALLAIVLSLAVMVIWMLITGPATAPRPAAQPQAPKSASGSPGSTPQSGPASSQTPASPSSETRQPESPLTETRQEDAHHADAGGEPVQPIQAAAREEFRLVTSTQDVRLTNEGGRVTWWRLLKYTINGGVPVDLVPDQARSLGVLPLQIQIAGDPEATRALSKALHAHELIDIPAGDPSGMGPGKRVTFTYADAGGLSVRKVLEIPEIGYLGRVSFEVKKHGRPVPATLVWASGLAQQAEDDTRKYGNIEGEALVFNGNTVIRIPPAKDATAQRFGGEAGPPVVWAGLDSTYFASLLLPAETAPTAPAAPMVVDVEPHQAPPTGTGTPPLPLLTAGVTVEGGGTYRLFVGPKDYNLLKSMGMDLERAIDFSRYSLIYLCTKGLFLALTWIHSYVGNYGWSIIILTAAVRLIFFPIMYKSSITMRQTGKKMAKIQPRVKSIQDRYRKMKKSMETQRQMNEEIMALYKKEGVNPMGNLGGCLPLLLQMPVFIGFYNLLAVTIEMRHAPFIFWIQDLSRRDPYYISPVLMGASWLAQQWMTSSSIPDPTQRRMMMFMPVMFTFFMVTMPSGLVVYWLTSNILGLAQQYLTNKKADQLEADAHGGSKAALA